MADDKWSGQPVEITPGTPKDVGKLRANLIKTLEAGTKTGATPFYGPRAAGPNALTTAAGDMVSRMAGYGGYGNAQRTTPPGGGGGNPGLPVTPGGGGYPGGATPLPTPVPNPMPIRPTDPGMGGTGRLGAGPGGQMDQQALLQMLMARAARQGGGMAGQAGLGQGVPRGGGTTYGA